MKKIVVISMIIVMVSFFVSCEQIEDTNGSKNTDLCQITMEDIADVNEDYFSEKTSTNTKFHSSLKMSHQNVYGIHEDDDVDYIKMKGGPTSGTLVLMDTLLDSNQNVIFSIEYNIESGNMQMFLISPSNEIIYEFEDETERHKLTTNEEGEYIIIIGAESFVGQIEIERHYE